MADSIHYTLKGFRDSLLTALARLEFEIRDHAPSSVPSVSSSPDRLDRLENMVEKLQTAVMTLQDAVMTLCDQTTETKALMSIPPPMQTRNILVSTPALSAAVAGLMPTGLDLEAEEETSSEEEDTSEDEVALPSRSSFKPEPTVQDVPMTVPAVVKAEPLVVDVDMTESEAESEAEVEESEDEAPDLRPIKLGDTTYYIDSSNTAYIETEEGYEEVGTYNSKLGIVEGVEEADDEIQAEEEEAEEIEVEDFVFKGQTYQRDADGNVYLDGEQVGTWNGKKILPLA